MKKNPQATIHDVARQAGVSIKTVSRVLNNESKVRPETRDRVLAAARTLKYRPNLSARSLAGERSYLIDLLYDNPSTSYISNIQMGALARCRRENYHLIVEQVDSQSTEIGEIVSNLIEQSRLDGVILTQPICDHSEILKVLGNYGIPLVRIAPGDPDDTCISIQMDDYKAAYAMTEHLISLGHREIAFIKGHPDYGVSQLRYRGYCEALKDHGISLTERLVKQGYFSYRSGLKCAEDLLGAIDQRPTAIFASNDDMAAAVTAIAHKFSIVIPEQLSVAGFDDTPIASVIWPQLTTVHQPIPAMASAAVEALIKRISTKGVSSVDNKHFSSTLDFKIMVRESTAKAAVVFHNTVAPLRG